MCHLIDIYIAFNSEATKFTFLIHSPDHFQQAFPRTLTDIKHRKHAVKYSPTKFDSLA